MTEQLSDQDYHWMTAMWADTARLQLVRFEEAVENYASALVDYEFRAVFHDRGDPPEWASEYATANEYLTLRQVWNVGAERYFLLLTLAQLRKCVLRLPSDDLPDLNDNKVLRLLRDIDEHWEQGDNGRSLAELREWKPHLKAEPGQFRFINGKHVWIGDTDLSEIAEWIRAVDIAVRMRARTSGSPIHEPEHLL